MESEGASIPEEYEDILLNEFAYDPIRLPPTEDRAQLLYNRRTLESIWDAKYEAVNPYTRQPFDVSNLIPQAQLREEMHRYIANRPNLSLSLEVIPDYTKVLSEGEMLFFFSELKSAYLDLFIGEKEKRDLESEGHWKRLWQKFNLIRLYCQYCPENRDVLRSVGGYSYLALVAEGRFYLLFRRGNDATETLKEVGRIVDIIGLKESDLHPDLFMGIVRILGCLVTVCDHLKTQGMVLRIYRRMFDDFNIEKYLGFWVDRLYNYEVDVTLYVLDRKNFEDIANEDLYNGMEILKASWKKNQISCIDSEFDFLGIIVDSVSLCISRFHYLHNATVAKEFEQRMTEKNNDEEEAAKSDDEAKKVHLISATLEGALSLINSIVTATSDEEPENQFVSPEEKFFTKSKERLQESVIVRKIVGMVELVIAGFKRVRSCHLQFGINIVAVLLKEEEDDEENRNEEEEDKDRNEEDDEENRNEEEEDEDRNEEEEDDEENRKEEEDVENRNEEEEDDDENRNQEEEDDRNYVVRVFGNFLRSDIVDEYDSHVKLLVQDVVQQLCSYRLSQ